ncbi:MAG: hypothetical protein ABII09_06075 [Planctomycetota bacterium]
MALDFDEEVARQQVDWRTKHVQCKEQGVQNGLKRPWILPENHWKDGLWEGIKESLPKYLVKEGIKRHTGCHNLKSSWMLCANLYFPFRDDKEMLACFLNKYVSDRIRTVDRIELEYEDDKLKPTELLGEPQGIRGANQTSPDVAFVVNGGRGLILTENKYTEHSFYPCSGRKPKYHNPDIKRCLDIEKVMGNPKDTCYMNDWDDGKRTNRKYWDFIKFSENATGTLKKCPAATAGYQLFRQQSLAEGIAQNGDYEFVISCVAYDQNNQALISCLKSTGIDDFRIGWGGLFKGKAGFASFSHQQFVNWVRENDFKGKWKTWLQYVKNRYSY